MPILTNKTKFALFLVFWVIVAFEKKTGLFNEFSLIFEISYLLFLCWVGFLTFKSWFSLSDMMVEHSPSIWRQFGASLLGGLAGLLFLLIPLSIMTSSSIESIRIYVVQEYFFENYSWLEQLLMTNMFVIISFFTLTASTNFVYWVNGNLIFFSLFILYPLHIGPARGWQCNGDWLSEEDGFLGASCNGVELNFRNEISYYDFIQNKWNLDVYSLVFADLVQTYFTLLIGLLTLGIIHIFWKEI